MTRHVDNVYFARLRALTAQFEAELLTERLIASKRLPPRNEGEGYLEWFTRFSRDQLVLMETRLEAAGLKNTAMWGFAVGHLRMRNLPEEKARSNSGLT